MNDRIARKPSEFSHGLVNQFVVGFGKRGGSPALMQWLVEHPAAFGRLVRFSEGGCPKLNPNGTLAPTLPEGPDLARLILRDDLISPQEMAKEYGWTYNAEQLAQLEESFPSQEAIVQASRDYSFIVPGPPQNTNLLGVRDLDPELFRAKSAGWYAEEGQKFSREDIVEFAKWLIIRKGDVPNSRNKTPSEQDQMVTAPAYIPNAAQAAYAFTAYKKVRGINLLPNFYVRTSSKTAGGSHVCVGGQSGGGLLVYDWHDYRSGDVGVASARKAP
jgi:hypothetical protein